MSAGPEVECSKGLDAIKSEGRGTVCWVRRENSWLHWYAMINNYELLILNYIFNAMHDFNSPYSINIGLALINLRQNRKVPIKEAGWELGGVWSCLLVPLAGGPRSPRKGICRLSPGTRAGPCQKEWEMDVNPWCVFRGERRERVDLILWEWQQEGRYVVVEWLLRGVLKGNLPAVPSMIF